MTAQNPDRISKQRRPVKVALLRKSRGILTWSDDLQDGFSQIGVETLATSFRPSSLAERVNDWQGNGKLFDNPATLRRIVSELGHFAPDLVIALNYPGLPDRFHAALRAALPGNTPIVGWLCDRIDSFPQAYEPCFDGVYYFDSSCLPALGAAYGSTSTLFSFLPLAASPSRYPDLGIPAGSRIPRLLFAGNCTPDRQSIFHKCRALGMPLDLYGPHAGNFPIIWRNRKFRTSTLARLYQQYACNLNPLQSGNTTCGLNMRAFEIPCTGGLATYPFVEDLPRCFSPGTEIIAYQSLEELADHFTRAISNPDFADSIARAGHARVMGEHTFRHRAERFIADWQNHQSHS
jgi:spore maturation protein CgeB